MNNPLPSGRYVKVNHHLIQWCVENDKLDEYCYFILFKSVFDSSVLHDSNLSKLSRLTSLNVKTVRTHVRRLIDLGWVRQTDEGHLLFCSLRAIWGDMKDRRLIKKRLRMGKYTPVFVRRNMSISEVKLSLSAALLSTNIASQARVSKLKDDVSKQCRDYDEQDRKDILRQVSKYSVVARDIENYDYGRGREVSMSCSGYGALLGKGATTGMRIKKSLVNCNFITVKPDFEWLDNTYFSPMSTEKNISEAKWAFLKRNLPGNYYYHAGLRRVKRRNADLVFLVNPPKPRPVRKLVYDEAEWARIESIIDGLK